AQDWLGLNRLTGIEVLSEIGVEVDLHRPLLRIGVGNVDAPHAAVPVADEDAIRDLARLSGISDRLTDDGGRDLDDRSEVRVERYRLREAGGQVRPERTDDGARVEA